MALTFPSDAVVVVAGVPGAGKTTLIRRAVDRDAVGVVDTDDRREPGPRRADRRGLLYSGTTCGSPRRSWSGGRW